MYHTCNNIMYLLTYTTEQAHTLSSSSYTDGHISPLLAALDLRWPVSLQLLMPCGACFTALPRGPNRLSISRWAAALFPINSPVQAGCRYPGAPSLEGGEERGGTKGEKLARKTEVESCHATGPEGCLKGLETVTSSAHKRTNTQQDMHQGTICLKNSIFKSSFYLTRRTRL